MRIFFLQTCSLHPQHLQVALLALQPHQPSHQPSLNFPQQRKSCQQRWVRGRLLRDCWKWCFRSRLLPVNNNSREPNIFQSREIPVRKLPVKNTNRSQDLQSEVMLVRVTSVTSYKDLGCWPQILEDFCRRHHRKPGRESKCHKVTHLAPYFLHDNQTV